MDDERPEVLIGVDGGGTKTQCVVLSCASLTSIASVRAGGCNGYASFVPLQQILAVGLQFQSKNDSDVDLQK